MPVQWSSSSLLIFQVQKARDASKKRFGPFFIFIGLESPGPEVNSKKTLTNFRPSSLIFRAEERGVARPLGPSAPQIERVALPGSGIAVVRHSRRLPAKPAER